MIIFIVDYFHICSGKAKGNPPVGLNRDRPDVFSAALQGMEPKAGQVHVGGRSRCLKANQDTGKFCSMLGLNSGPAAGPLKFLQPLVQKTFNHMKSIINSCQKAKQQICLQTVSAIQEATP